MFVFVKILNGAEHKIEVEQDEKVSRLKELVETYFKVPVSQQRLVFKGKPMPDTSTLKDYDIKDNTKIYLSIKKEELVKELTVQEILNRELKEFGKAHFQDADKFVETFNKELKFLIGSLSLDDIERYNKIRYLATQASEKMNT